MDKYIYLSMHTPFFPQLRPRLAALGRRVHRLRQQSLAHLEQLFAPWLPPELLSQTEEGPNSRERVYNVRRTFFGFLYQVLKPSCPCREIVRQVQALFCLHDQRRVDENTSAYCQARDRLSLDRLQRLRMAVAAAGEKMTELWHDLRPKVIEWHHAQPARHRQEPASLSTVQQPEAWVRLSADEVIGGVQPGFRRVARLRQGQQTPI